MKRKTSGGERKRVGVGVVDKAVKRGHRRRGEMESESG